MLIIGIIMLLGLFVGGFFWMGSVMGYKETLKACTFAVIFTLYVIAMAIFLSWGLHNYGSQ